ncbi:amidase [Azoarcus sp. L1K30]|uniref:amidase n=1 Tax=Azoarcus sp. L1K30 TaxID=2820277 RepID=UPI001B81FD87|nr:amidase [Azoarcus sp. L1K30]MBR0566102.1 amidase [Azoarcus sp. L1K30]
MLIDRDPAHAFVPYPAVELAHAAEGPLAGLSFAVKDLFDVTGYPTGGGNPHVLALSGIKTRTAPTVQRLLDSGARFVGKTYTDELAFSMNGINAHFGAPINGGAPERITGGSSSGSAAAVSNGLVDFALGTDTGGSVRCPANHCGLFGLRPTHGRISLENCLDLAPSFDSCGFFARDAGTFARVGDVLLGIDTAPLPAHVRMLYPEDGWGLLEDIVCDALKPALDRIEALFGKAAFMQMAPKGFDRNYWAFRYIQGREAWQTDGDMIERHGLALGPGVRDRFAWSKQVTDTQVEESEAIRSEVTAVLSHVLGEDGVMVLPTMPDIAPLLSTDEAGLEDYRNNAIKLLCLAGLSGFPQLSMPLATRLGAPLGISLLGPAGSDRSLIAMAQKIASAA